MLRSLALVLASTLTLACKPEDSADTTETGASAPETGGASVSASSTSAGGSTSTSGGPGGSSSGSSGSETSGTSEVGETSGTSGASEVSEPGTSGTGGSDTGETGMVGCVGNDNWEPNDLPESATSIAWGSVSQYAAYFDIDAFLCQGESDWYYASVEPLDYRFYGLFIDAFVEGASWCGKGCGDPSLPDAPENTMGVDVYDAQTLQLLTEQVVENGRINIGGAGPEYAKDLLIRVHGPSPVASYPYRLVVEIRGYDGEDECEC